MKNVKSFDIILKENLDSFEEDYASFIDCGPKLFRLLSDILNKQEIPKNLRLDISAAIAYYVIPNDVIPEDIYGPYGYIDDIFVAVYVLREVADEFGYEFLQKIWNSEIDVKKVMDECYNSSLELLEDKVYAILVYIGLMD